MPTEFPTVEARDLKTWREWLAKHHASSTGVWLVFPKKHTRRPTVSYSDALDEAICFGWIDNLVKRIDENRYAMRFTPRKADSAWSEVNRKRYAKLEASGRLQPAGKARSPAGRRTAVAPARSVTKLPAYIERAIRKNPAAWRFFQQLPPSQYRMYIGWIDSAKRQDTKERRLADAVKRLAAGERLGIS